MLVETFAIDERHTDVNFVELHEFHRVYRVCVVCSRSRDLIKFALPTLSILKEVIFVGNDSGTAKLGKLRLDVTIVDIGDLSLDEVA